MIIKKLESFTRGWFVGPFDPSIHKTNDFEVGIVIHRKGDEWPCHYHSVMEINYLISGKMKIHDELIVAGDVFMLDGFEIADPVFLTDCHVVTIKTPARMDDKYLADRPTYV